MTANYLLVTKANIISIKYVDEPIWLPYSSQISA